MCKVNFMEKKMRPVAALSICQQCSLTPKPKGRNGRARVNPEAQALTRDVVAAVRDDAVLANTLCVRATRCQGACDQPIAFSLNSEKGEGWQWSGLGRGVSVEEVISIAKTYLHHVETGVRVVKKDWPEGKGKWFFCRIPAFPRVAKWVRSK
ncbi:MAG: hypothetical protein COY40_01650 [Alphaproteobacteria bacterium CG_4_10_14_0_8_um_filter_53_9]|nr:MAG: hypothetical protein COY40_01650 [Alphaproteobacteria bacterium CG_4_10_14_0_8_um_filter_53_9]